MISLEFNKLNKQLSAWLLAGLVAVFAWLWAGWSPWLQWYLLLLGSALSARLLLELARRLGLTELRLELIAAIAVAALAGAAASGALFYIERTVSNQNPGEVLIPLSPSWAFSFWVASGFAAALLVSEVLAREANFHANHARQLAELRLKALQAQIEPHFLYNTLANVQQLVRSAPPDADRMLAGLIHYLKASIPDVRGGMTTLRQELGRAEAYLTIMQIRLGRRLRYEVEVPEALLEAEVPPLSLMTLVENAVKHGVDAKPEGGLVRILADRSGECLRLRVIDDGAGFAAEAGAGTGLTNLRERSLTLYGKRAALELLQADGSGVEAVLEIPLAFGAGARA